MPLAPFGWQNTPSTATPLSAQELELFAQYLAAYAESLGGSGTGTPAIPFGGTNRAGLVTDSGATGTGGVRWSPGSAPYNVCENTGSTPGASPTASAAANTAAINAKLAEAAGKAQLLIPPGIFNVMDGVRWPSNTEVYGHGRKSVLKVDSSVIQGVVPFLNSDTPNGNSNITLRNFEIDGNMAARGAVSGNPNGTGMMDFRGTNAPCSYITLDGMWLHHSTGIGSSFIGAEHVRVLNCKSWGHGRDGLSSTGYIKDVHWIGNEVWNCGDDMIANSNNSTTASQDIVVANNILHDATAPGPGGQGGGLAIDVTGARNCAIVGNVISRPYSGGIQLAGFSDHPADLYTVAGNVILDAGQPQVPAGVGDTAWGIEIHVRSDYGVPPKVSAAVSNCIVADNTIMAPMSHGIVIVGNATNNVSWMKIDNNTLIGGFGSNYYGGAHGIHFSNQYASLIKLSNNTIRDWRGRAVNGNGQAISYVHLVNNDIWSCCKNNPGFSVIDLTNSVNCHVRNNTVRDFQANHGAVLARGGSAGMRVIGNDFTAGGTSDVSGAVASGYIEHANIDHLGVMNLGDATVGTL